MTSTKIRNTCKYKCPGVRANAASHCVKFLTKRLKKIQKYNIFVKNSVWPNVTCRRQRLFCRTYTCWDTGRFKLFKDKSEKDSIRSKFYFHFFFCPVAVKVLVLADGLALKMHHVCVSALASSPQHSLTGHVGSQTSVRSSQFIYVEQYRKPQICLQGLYNLCNTQQPLSLDPGFEPVPGPLSWETPTEAWGWDPLPWNMSKTSVLSSLE